MDLLSESIKWYSQGIATIPITFKAKQPAGMLLPVGPDGRRTWEPYKTRLPEPDELVRWFGSNRRINMAILTGWQNLTVIDFDRYDYYQIWRAAYPDVSTFIVKTGRGAHVYLFVDHPTTGANLDGIDIKAGGGYVLGVGSVHPSGAVYQVMDDSPILRIRDIAEVLPGDLLPQATPKSVQLAPTPAPVVTNPFEAAFTRPVNLCETIKARIPIIDYLPGDLFPTGGGWFVTICPLHDDHRPSLSVHPKAGICKCLSGCNGGRVMDVINLYSWLKFGGDNWAALQELQRRL